MQAKIIAVRAGLSRDRTRHLLPHMVAKGRLKRVGRGFYTLTGPREDEVELRFENLVVVARSTMPSHRGGPLEAFQSRIDVVSRRAKMPGWQGSGKTETRTFFGPFAVYIQQFDNGTVEIQSGSRGGPSMSVLDLLKFGGWLEGHFPEIPDSGPGGWHVRTFELNHDFEGLRFDRTELAGKAVSFRLFQNVILKLYEKRGGIRMELRALKTTVPMDTMMGIARDIASAYLRLGLIRTEESGP